MLEEVHTAITMPRPNSTGHFHIRTSLRSDTPAGAAFLQKVARDTSSGPHARSTIARAYILRGLQEDGWLNSRGELSQAYIDEYGRPDEPYEIVGAGDVKASPATIKLR